MAFGSPFLVTVVLGVVQCGASEASVCNAGMDPSDPACVAAKGASGLGMVQKKSSIESATVESEGNAAEESASMAEVHKAMARDRTRVKLGVERDLSQLSADHYRTWDDAQTCAENANAAFDQYVTASNVSTEMTSSEMQCFRFAFDADVEAQCKAHIETSASWTEEIARALEDEKPVLTQAMVEAINAAHGSSYTVSAHPCLTRRELRSMTGLMGDDDAVKSSILLAVKDTEEVLVRTPETFNPDTKWPECVQVIHAQHNQGTCGICWAFGATSALDSRVCIASGGTYQGQLSRTVLTSCGSSADGCSGGMPSWVFRHIGESAVPSGGSDGCMPYFAHGDGKDHFSSSQSEPPCPTECIPSFTTKTFADDSLTLASASNYQFKRAYSTGSLDFVPHLKNSIFNLGPVPYAMTVVSEFYGYTSGIFDSGCGQQANHCLVALGWGKSADGVLQWDTLNSWGPGSGNNGHYKVASCVISWYEVPGDITADVVSYSSRWGPPTPPTPPTPNPTLPPTTVTITGDGCKVDADGCMSNQNYPASPYAHGKSCEIQGFTSKIRVMDFNTEGYFDFLTVNGQKYSGANPANLENVEPSGSIKWSSDGTVAANGWKICPHTPVAPSAPPTASSTEPPTAPPTASWTEPPTAPPTASWTEPPTAPPTASWAEPPLTYSPTTAFQSLDTDGDDHLSESEFAGAIDKVSSAVSEALGGS